MGVKAAEVAEEDLAGEAKLAADGHDVGSGLELGGEGIVGGEDGFEG